ncbi:MAG: class I SAM-dependent methyltransferase [Deltaproteobacteria bacterium CG_4_9_14_3_um_filter_63_12]|nr:MAG: class I SAM-dependent methyltransferase [Deltaproteobacteria bacterium CG_4_9_14_3_um_filter_63_12]
MGDEMSAEEKAKWNRRYAESGTQNLRREPKAWLGELAELLPRSGAALDLGAGEGQTAIFFAQRGLDAEAWDLSEVALRKAHGLARQAGVTLWTRCVDLDEAPDIEPDKYAVISCLHFLNRALIPAIAAGLRPGGVVVVEILGTPNLERSAQPSRRYLVEPGELDGWFPQLETLVRYDGWVGERYVCRMLARRRA